MSAQTPGSVPSHAQGVARLAFTSQAQEMSATTTETTTKRSSAPGTPQPAAEKHAPPSPLLQRRSSAQLVRPSSSASPKLMRKTSRSSLGSSSPAPHDDRRPTPKRSISNLITELRGAQATMEAIPEPVVLTAPEIATECFKKELAHHEMSEAETVVLLHDACYGHRFARPKSTKGTLSMIVERPERLLASVLGIATAYVRLGGYHTGAKNALHPKHTSSDPPFKIRRTARALDIKSTYVTNVHGFEWMAELGTMCDKAAVKLAAGEKEVARLATVSGQDRRMLHEGDLYLCQESLSAFQGALGGVADAVDTVFSAATNTTRAFVAVRPPGHHCSADYPSGFCWINNVHVGIEYAAQTYDLTHAAIIDFDLHHGDGSQAIAWERNTKNHSKRMYPKSFTKTKLAPDIGYYSLHDINSYPCEMGDDEKVQAASLCIHNAHGQSIWNVHLQPWKTVEEFWALYESRYLVLLDKAREFLQLHTNRINLEGKQRPKAAIFISAGFDASEWEGEGMQRHKVNVPTSFYARFTEDIMRVAREIGTGCDGRVISVLEGGYSDRALCSSTISHLSALCATPSAQPETQPPSSLGMSMQGKALDQRMQDLSLKGTYDSSWWSAANLEALELHVNPPPPMAGGKKMRAGPQPTYATPTESFAYKVIDPAKFARSVSGTLREGSTPTRSTTPPPPEVDWIVAAHELSKLLTPSDRTTKSHTAEELAGPKKKDRTSGVGLTPSPDELGKPRQLRTRGKITAPMTPAQPSKRAVSNGDRRKTMADFPSAFAEAGPVTIQPRRASRRSSMASTASTIATMPDAGAPPLPSVPTTARPLPRTTISSEHGVQVKKTRPVSSTVTKPEKPSIPMPRAQPANAANTSLSSTGNGLGSSRPGTSEVEALATGMKRITLKVGTREENERKAKEKLDAERRARALKGAETRRINKAAKEAKAAEEKRAASTANIRPPTEQGQVSAAQPATSLLQAPVQAAPVPQPDMTAYLNSDGFAAQHYNGDPAYDTNAHFHSQSQPETNTVTDNLPHFDINTSQTAAIPPQFDNATRGDLPPLFGRHMNLDGSGDLAPYLPYEYTIGHPMQSLPVFTSTGHIPFAPAPNHTQQQPDASHQQSEIHHPVDYSAMLPTGTAAEVYEQRDGSMGQQYHTYAPSDMDVWALPDTPSKQNFRGDEA